MPNKESFQIRKVFRKGKFSNEESAEAKANKESSVRRLFEIQIADLSFLVQRCAHTAAVISSYLGSKISRRCTCLFFIQHSKFKRRLHLKRKDWTDIFPLLHINDCILLPLLQSMRVPPLLEAWSAHPSSSESLSTCIFPYEHQATTFLPLLAALDRSSFLFKHKVRSFPILKAICAPTSFWSLAVRFFPLLQQLGQ